jgi:hypothetical protein
MYFVFVYEKKMNFKFIRNTLLTPYAGLHGDLEAFTQKEFNLHLQNIFRQLPKFDIFHIDIHPSVRFNLDIQGFQIMKKRTNILRLEDKDLIHKNFKPALQRQIKKFNTHLKFISSQDTTPLYNLLQQSLAKRDEKINFTLGYLQKLYKHCKLHDAGHLFYAIDKNNNYHAGLFLVHDATHSYYLCGGSNSLFPNSGAMSGLMWQAIQTSIALGKSYFDFEGSMITGINNFFKNFAPQEYSYWNIQKNNSFIFKLINKK